MTLLPVIKEAPLEFDGTLDELFEGWAKHVLLGLSAVEEFHHQFREYYLEVEDPLYLPRNVTGLVRGLTLRMENGTKLRATDNSPAWWIHYQLFTGEVRKFTEFSSLVEAAPSHMFQVRLPNHVSKAGWHIAHIFDVKDRNINFQGWTREELLRRTARNIHPCNYFYIPKSDWQRHGGDARVTGFFYKKFKELYAPIWEDFLLLMAVKPSVGVIDTGSYNYSFTKSREERRSTPIGKPDLHMRTSQIKGLVIETTYCVAEYVYSRLCFRADVIEPLAMEDRFCIVTPEGSFAMTKREFYETFQNVVESKSYRLKNVYHYPTTPQKALRFKVS